MSEDSRKEVPDRLISLMDLAGDLALKEALNILPETEHVIANDIPAVFGSKWRNKFHIVRESLTRDYQAQTDNVIKLTAHYYEYARLSCAAQVRLIIEHDSKNTHPAAPLFRMVTPEGYEEYEGWASVATENIYSTRKPQALAEKYGFSEYPKDADLMSAQGLIWFFKAAELQQAGRQEAFDVLFEAAEMCESAWGCLMWLGGEESANEEGENSNPAALLARRRHAETYTQRDEALNYWRERIDRNLSAAKAAEELVRMQVVGLSHKTLAALIAAERKKLP